MIIKVLGSGCKNCQKLYNNTLEAIQTLEIEAQVIKVEDIKVIMAYGVMKTPALVIDEEVKTTGRVLKVKEIINILNN